ncbi:replication endonuclease [Marinobacter sp. F4216]|uniref:replication endonuclease n=1 Tax=Marinobacter sp. F4216 TaxID=2874281 RepID=UPI001CBA8120|nr:replication endonuclease [Marinobacter sp. F4216]MBZ2168028.1 replication endonuclease [Marinobacter sp. F4216]
MSTPLPVGPFNWLKGEGRPYALGDIRSRKMLRTVEERHPYLKERIFSRYLRIADSSTYHQADMWLEGLLDRLHLNDDFGGLKADSPFELFRSFSEKVSQRLEREFTGHARAVNGKEALHLLIRETTKAGMPFPVDQNDLTDKEKVIPGVARVFDPAWWRRKLRTKAYRNSESIYRELGLVSKAKNLYISEYNFRRYLAAQASNAELLELLTAENQFGYTATLASLKEKSVSNPRNRRNETMMRIGGLEDYADENGHVGVFYTLTCPSKYHATHQSGHANGKFDGSSPLEAQKYLTKVWGRVRAAFKRTGIEVYGIRTVEPHHDGTPHWHLLLFMAREFLPEANRIFREHALKEDGDESGAEANRFVIEEIDPEKGRATGYVAKYVSKCIDGYEVGEDSYGNDAVESAARIRAWASIWGIRQFQFTGDPGVTVYRELRRLKNIEGSREGLLQELEIAADNGDWKRYVELMGGTCTHLKDRPLRALMVPKPTASKYHETVEKLKGLVGSAGRVVTRIYDWTISRTRPADDDLQCSDSCEVVVRGANAPPWSSVNNCTRLKSL